MNVRIAFTIALSALALAGCGNKGPLVQAPPKPAEEAPAEPQTAPPAQETPTEPAAEPAPEPSTETPPPAQDGGG